MIEELNNGMLRLENLAHAFASKQRLELDPLVIDGGAPSSECDRHVLELRCKGQQAHMDLSTEELINVTISVQHKLLMELMKFVPLSTTLSTGQ